MSEAILALRMQDSIVSVPWRGCVVSAELAAAVAAYEFPSPGGDVLCPAFPEWMTANKMLPSPGGDVLCLWNSGSFWPWVSVPWRGCVVSADEAKDYFCRLFPSPGGDVLCPDEARYLCDEFCFRPLAGMCCVGNSS